MRSGAVRPEPVRPEPVRTGPVKTTTVKPVAFKPLTVKPLAVKPRPAVVSEKEKSLGPGFLGVGKWKNLCFGVLVFEGGFLAGGVVLP